MKFEVHIDKRHVFMILGAILILAGAIYAYAVAPNPGHDWSEIGNVPADLADGDDFEANTDNQDLSLSGNTLSLTNGGSVTLPSSGRVVGKGWYVQEYWTGECNSFGYAFCTGSSDPANPFNINCPSGTTKIPINIFVEDSYREDFVCVAN